MSKIGERVKSESRACIGTHNAGMVCVDCIFRYDDSKIPANASRCEAFPNGKPYDIIFGETMECSKYLKE